MENEMNLSEVARAAKAIRAALKVAFPGTKFAVRSESFSMGDAVRIKWTDGPATDAVETITGAFAAGSFDGSDDHYEYAKDRKGPTAKYVTCTREISAELHALVLADLVTNGESYADEVAYRVLRKSDLRAGFGGIVSVQDFPFYAVVPAVVVAA